MAEGKTFKVFGSPVPRGYVYAGAGVVGIAVIYGWRKNKQQSVANASAPSTPSAVPAASGGDPYPPDGTSGNPGDPNSTDPATGQTYGDEGQFSSGYGAMSDLGYGSGGYYGGGGGYYPPGVTGGTTYTDNAQWSQAAESYLTETVGADPNTVAAALGKYITGQPVSDAQVSVIEQAIAFGGYPPVEGPAGFPPSFHTASPPGTPPPHGGKPPAGHPGKPGTAPGPVTARTSASDLTVSWPAVGGSTHYQVVVAGPKDGTKAAPVVTATHAVFSIATAGTNGAVRVRAGNSAGWGPWSATRTFRFAAASRIPSRK